MKTQKQNEPQQIKINREDIEGNFDLTEEALTRDLPKNEPQLSAEIEKRLIGNNLNSVYTLCYECHSWGVNLPLNHKCGNCNSSDTMIYYDIETVTQAITTALEEQRTETLNEVESLLPEWIDNPYGESTYSQGRKDERNELRAKLAQMKGKDSTSLKKQSADDLVPDSMKEDW